MTDFDSAAKLFKTLMHPARLEILDILRGGEACVCHMEAALGYRQAYISQQLMVLREAGLVQDRREGWNIFYRVVQPAVYEVIDAALRTVGKSQVAARRKATRIASCTCPTCQPLEKTPA